ncbi:hypothetical protein ACP70R_029051 [Stipagrostis hirtigluma subsp. patula]
MFMDTSNMNEVQKAYLETMRAQILASKMGGTGGGA